MDETFKAATLLLIGWALGIVSTFLNDWLQAQREQRKAQAEREKEIRKRLVGDRIQTSEVMGYIEGVRKRGEKPDLSRANLSSVDLRYQNLQGVKLYRANLDGADLNGVNLQGADLSKASLRDAKLYGAKLQNAQMLGAKLAEARMKEADLSGANLEVADLSQAYLSGRSAGD